MIIKVLGITLSNDDEMTNLKLVGIYLTKFCVILGLYGRQGLEKVVEEIIR